MTGTDGAPRPDPDVVDALATALLATGRSRIDRRQLWTSWDQADTAYAGSWASRARLADALHQLEATGTIRLPAPSGKLWDAALPPLPRRLDVPANRRSAGLPTDTVGELWVPTMRRWAPQWIRTARPPLPVRQAAVQINRWLQSTLGTDPQRVAREERSLHIFSDEKRLARLADGALFAPGRMSLDQLSCDAPMGHLRVGRLTTSGPVLVVENKATFDSAWRAQRACSTPTWAAILFGAGDAAAALVRELSHLHELIGVTPSAFYYAGDVDAAGIEAAAAFANGCATAGLDARMALPLWDAVARAEPTGDDLTVTADRAPMIRDAAMRLGLPDSVHLRLREAVRVPQERVDRQALYDLAWWSPPP